MMMMSVIKAVSCVLIFLVTSLPRDSLSCFPLQDMFASSRHWLQIISFNSRRVIDVEEEPGDMIEVKTEGQGRSVQVTLRCTMAYGEHRYLVKEERDNEIIWYRCYQFTQLMQHVIRLGRTEGNTNRKKVNCIEDHYVEDEEVLIAYKDIQPHRCPLYGGYQVVAKQGMVIDGRCMNSVQKYNPNMQFHCDWRGSGNVVADFGKECVPVTLVPLMGGQYMTHLRCVSEWVEDGFHSVLLQMRDHPENFWCLHFKPVDYDNGGYESLDKAKALSIFLTVDGRCSSKNFGDEDVPRNTSMFGLLFKYSDKSDTACSDKHHLDSCQSNGDKCLESTNCPSKCERCKKEVDIHNCSFPPNLLGIWKIYNSERKLEIILEKTRIKSPSFTDFLCMRPSEVGLPNYTYSVVQAFTDGTCMPYFACAVITSPNPGILTFQLRPAFRNQETGDPLSCKESQAFLGHITPPESERAVTLINQNHLKKTNCNQKRRLSYSTSVQGCTVVINACKGSCQTLNVTFETPSCENVTDIENIHICYAAFVFEDEVRGVLARTFTSGKYLCWLFGATNLFVASPDYCNQESVYQIFSDVSANYKYDAIKAISLSLTDEGPADKCALHTSTISFYMLIVGYILQRMLVHNVDT